MLRPLLKGLHAWPKALHRLLPGAPSNARRVSVTPAGATSPTIPVAHPPAATLTANGRDAAPRVTRYTPGSEAFPFDEARPPFPARPETAIRARGRTTIGLSWLRYPAERRFDFRSPAAPVRNGRTRTTDSYTAGSPAVCLLVAKKRTGSPGQRSPAQSAASRTVKDSTHKKAWLTPVRKPVSSTLRNRRRCGEKGAWKRQRMAALWWALASISSLLLAASRRRPGIRAASRGHSVIIFRCR